MTKIYREANKELKDLLAQAGLAGDATLVIPDLQRPYIWQPLKVIVLVDSLIRGWPFGTLLTWKVATDDPIKRLARGFWRVVDRTGLDDHPAAAMDKSPGTVFDMVLDGQQRVQSLLLAFGNESWGFRLLDSDWNEVLGKPSRKSKAKSPPWSHGSLCVNLPELAKQYEEKKNIANLDFTKILEWVVTDTGTGRSPNAKGDGPLPLAQDVNCQGKYLRLSALWKNAPEHNIDNFATVDIAQRLLVERFPALDQAPQFERPLAALLFKLSEVKKTTITYLELAMYKEDQGSRENYNDAIVNIFTRLNTAGRTLTREDIVFAWLNTGWKAETTNQKNARVCIADLKRSLDSNEFKILPDEIVSCLAILWATSFSGGKLLNDDDLMRGDVIQPMAANVSESWALVNEAALLVSQTMQQRGLFYQEVFDSVNSVAVLWAWCFQALRWRDRQPLNETQKDSVLKEIRHGLNLNIDRWLICSRWAGVWSENKLADYTSKIGALRIDGHKFGEQVSYVTKLSSILDEMIRGFEAPAIQYINSLNALTRTVVSMYYTPLWVWCRLDATRWKNAEVLQRHKSGSVPVLDVDHVVSWASFKNKALLSDKASLDPKTGGLTDRDFESQFPEINSLGNCILLERRFNSSKGKQAMSDFLSRLYEFGNDCPKELKADENEWMRSQNLEKAHVRSTETQLEAFESLFEGRAEAIRQELISFIKGNLSRKDVSP